MTSTNCSLPTPPAEHQTENSSTESLDLQTQDHIEKLLDKLAFVQKQYKVLEKERKQLLDELTAADENGLLNDYQNIDNIKQMIWEGLTITKTCKTTKTFSDGVIEEINRVKEEIKQIEFEATRFNNFTKTTSQHWTLRVKQ